MPLVRYQIRNEYGLADPELYNSADGDDPEALLEGVAMAGLVGVLRQLGDLAQFAAEIFHDLHEDVMSTTSRGHALLLRVQQVEAEFPYLEKPIHSQTGPSHFLGISGVDWHANFRVDQNLITQGDMPRFVLDFYEECRGPPRLFMLDKFDIAGAGACLKRYSDPSFCKTNIAFSDGGEEDIPRERKAHKMKKKGLQWKNGGTLESLFSLRKDSSSLPEMSDKVTEKTMTRRVKLKSRSLKVDDTYRTYMTKLLEENFVEHEVLSENTIRRATKTMDFVEANQSFPGIQRVVNNPLVKASVPKEIMPNSSPSNEVITLSLKEPKMLESENADSLRVTEMLNVDTSLPLVTLDKMSGNTESIRNGYHNQSGGVEESSCIQEVRQKELLNDDTCKKGHTFDGYISDDVTGELDNFVDALNSMDSEAETDNEGRVKGDPESVNVDYQELNACTNKKQLELRGAFSESTSLECSSPSVELNNLYKNEVPAISNHGPFRYLAGSLSTEGDNHSSVVANLDSYQTEGSGRTSMRPQINREVKELESLDDCTEYADCRTSEGLKEAKEIELDSSVHLGFVTSDIKGTDISSSGSETAEASEPSSKKYYIVPQGCQDDGLANALTSNKTLVICEQDTSEPFENIYPDHPCDLDNSEVFSPANNSGLPTAHENCATDSTMLSEHSVSGDEKGSPDVPCLLSNYAGCLPHSEPSPEREPEMCVEQDSEAVLDKCTPSVVGTSGSVSNSTTMQFMGLPLEMNNSNTVQPIVDIENLTSGIDSEHDDGEFIGCNASVNKLQLHDLCRYPDVMEAQTQMCVSSSMSGLLSVLEESFQSCTIPETETHDTHVDETVSLITFEPSHDESKIDSAIRDEIQMGTPQSDHMCEVTEHDSCSIFSPEHFIDTLVRLQEVNNPRNVDQKCHIMEALETTREKDDMILVSPDTHILSCSEESDKQGCALEISSHDSLVKSYNHDGANNVAEQDFCSELPSEGSMEHELGTSICSGEGVCHRLSHHSIDDVELSKVKADIDLNVKDMLHAHLPEKEKLFSTPNISISGSAVNCSYTLDDDNLLQDETLTPCEHVIDSGSRDDDDEVASSERECNLHSEPSVQRGSHNSQEYIFSSSHKLNGLTLLSQRATEIEDVNELEFSSLTEDCEDKDHSLVSYLHDRGKSTGETPDLSKPDLSCIASTLEPRFSVSKEISKELSSSGCHKSDLNCIASTPEPRYSVSKEIEEELSSSDCHKPDALISLQNTSNVNLSNFNTTLDCSIGLLESTSPKLPEQMPDEPTSLSLQDLTEDPPLPPLPPIQWRTGKLPFGERHSDGNVPNGTGQNPFMLLSITEERRPHDVPTASHGTGMLPDIATSLKETEEAQPYSGRERELLQSMISEPPPISRSMSHKNDALLPLGELVHPSNPPTQALSAVNNNYFAHDFYTLHQSNPFAQLLAAEHQITQFSSENIPQHGTQDADESTFAQTSYNERSRIAEVIPDSESRKSYNSQQDSPHLVNDDLQRLNPYWIVSTTQNAKEYFGANGCENLQPGNMLLPLQNIGPTIPPYSSAAFIGQNPFSPYHVFEHSMDDEKPHRKRSSILNRPRSPLIQAVASHDKSTLRKVSDMVQHVAKPKEGEKNTWLEQIKNKSFNLKPMVAKRSSIKGPTTNLKVAAILEKANSIRQACVGSDNDSDEDWSDP